MSIYFEKDLSLKTAEKESIVFLTFFDNLHELDTRRWDYKGCLCLNYYQRHENKFTGEPLAG